MDGLTFIVVIILFSLLEGVLRKRKAGRALPPGQAPEEEQYDPAQEEQYVPTYDTQPSYDDRPSHDESPSYDDQIDDIPESSSPYRTVLRSPAAPPPPETLIPKDVWEEVAGLVSGVRPSGLPAESEPRSEATIVASRASYQPTSEQEHVVHRTHVGYGTDPSSRAPSEQDGLDPLAKCLAADARAVHQVLSSRDPHVLRQAIILQEVLGPPAAFRGDPYDL
jgi:hypothetical protein